MKKNILILSALFLSKVAFAQTDTTITAMIDSLPYMKAGSFDCDAALYWRIIAKKQEAIPFLIEKLTDTMPTNVYYHCKNAKLNVGEVADFALKEIGYFPVFLVTQIQFDLIDSAGCWNFYGYLFDNLNKADYQKKVRNWYLRNKDKYKEERVPIEELNKCRSTYKIYTYYKWMG